MTESVAWVERHQEGLDDSVRRVVSVVMQLQRLHLVTYVVVVHHQQSESPWRATALRKTLTGTYDRSSVRARMRPSRTSWTTP